MYRTRVLSRLVVGTFVLLGSCAPDRPDATGVAAVPPAPSTLVSELLEPSGLLQCTPLPYASTTQVVGHDGGVLQVGPHFLAIPPGALAAPVTITAEAPVGTVNAVQFWPHGLTFARPVYLTMSYANCNTLGQLIPKRIAYTTDAFEILEYILSWDFFRAQRVTGRVNHFSTYAVAW